MNKSLVCPGVVHGSGQVNPPVQYHQERAMETEDQSSSRIKQWYIVYTMCVGEGEGGKGEDGEGRCEGQPHQNCRMDKCLQHRLRLRGGSVCNIILIQSLIAEKRQLTYQMTMGWMRCHLNFSLLRSAIICLRGAQSNSKYAIRSFDSIDLAVSEANLST